MTKLAFRYESVLNMSRREWMISAENNTGSRLEIELPPALHGRSVRVRVDLMEALPSTMPPPALRRPADVRLQRQQEALLELARSSVISDGNLTESWRLITEMASRTIDVDRVGVWLLSPLEGVLRCVDQYDRRDGSHTNGQTLSTFDHVAYFDALDSEEIIAAHDAWHDARTSSFADSYLKPSAIVSMLDAPVRYGGQTIGVLCCEHVGNVRIWATEEQNFATYLAHMVPLAMEGRERRRAEGAMERSHAELMATLEATADGVHAEDLFGRLTSFNARFVEMWNIPDTKLTAVDSEERAEFLATQTLAPDTYRSRVREFAENPMLEGSDVILLQDGRIFERMSRPVVRGDEPVGRVWSYRDVTAQRRAEEALQHEKQKSERLLQAMLPGVIAERLKQTQGPIADHFESASVLFADLVDFTQLSSAISPGELVSLLNAVFSTFDQLAEKHGVEKIKTIGDNYMAVAGVPLAREDHAAAMASMAIDMRTALADFCRAHNKQLRIRVGIHSGPVVAGVIGITRLAYDLWGSTVNTASRMESHGMAGQIQISEETRLRLDDRYLVEPRGVIEIKHMGPRPTWWLLGHRDGVSTGSL